MPSPVEKVTAFVTRSAAPHTDLLLFEHPSAGIQIPAGTVEAGEAPAAAAAREAREETGLADLGVGRLLDTVTGTLPYQHYMVATTTSVYARPDTASAAWARLRRGLLVACHRDDGGFCHITYAERDEQADPPYVSYQITGWVPSATLTNQVTRYFYHFPYHGQTPERWWVETDQHRFRLFWAPLATLPPLVAPQQGWLDVLRKAQPWGSSRG